MSGTITGELRELLADINWTEIIDHMRLDHGAILDGDWLDSWHAAAGHLCDAIDAVHANLEAENESLRRELDRVLGEREDRDGWIRLPLDADGVPIRFGDVLDQFGTPMTVFAMSDPDPDQGDCMLELITDGVSDSTWVRARKMRHHHAPTVEDVLLEACKAYHALMTESMGDVAHDMPAPSEVIAEYAAKLRLAGDAE